ncbi:F-box protein At4g22280-like [Carex rostrata]
MALIGSVACLMMFAHISYLFLVQERPCILSKRWRKTWASVPDLKFDIKEFGLPGLENLEEDMAVEYVTKFKQLVKSVLEKRETSCVNRFRLWLDSGVYWPCTQAVANYIGDVINLEPRECSVKLCPNEKFNLNTDLIFTCASLIYLQLCFYTSAYRFLAIEPNTVNLPLLKTLNLDGVIMSDGVLTSDDSLKRLLLGCSVLENLVLENCYISIMEICSKTLKKLVLSSCIVNRLQISTPNLLYLDIYGTTRDIQFLNMPSLVDASINIPGWYDNVEYVTRGPKLIQSFSSVEFLRLEFDDPEQKVHKKDFSNCPVFNNLKRLELVSWRLYVFDLPPYFLHHSPKLQELTLENKNAWVTEVLLKETTPEGPSDALVQREFLKTVRIVGFENDNGFVDRLINKLLAHVKIIGEIIV